MISKALSTSEKFAALVEEAHDFAEFCQALYPLIVSHSDDFGRLQGDAFTIKHLCHPTSPRSVPQFERALKHLHNVQLIGWYHVSGRWYVEIQNFDLHQTGIHKRTKSIFPEFPGFSGKFREIPSELNLTELNLTEGKGTEEKRREDAADSLQPASLTVLAKKSGSNGNGKHTEPIHGRSKRPIFQGQRFTVFGWMLEEFGQVLGPHLDDFDMHQWFFDLDTATAKSTVVLPKAEQWPWLQQQLLTEATKRGLPIQTKTAQAVSDIGRQNIENGKAAVARILSR